MRGKVLAITQLLLAGSFLLPRGGPADGANSDLDRTLAKTVRPFLTSYCVGCHGGAAPAAQFDLGSYATMPAVTRDYPRWNLVLEKLTAREMPPKPAPQPPDAARQTGIDVVP